MKARFLRGDVTALPADVGTGYRLILDFGAFHGLSDPQRKAMGEQVNAAAAPEATLLMVAFEPGWRGPLPRGANRADIQAAFPGWTITDEHPLPTQRVGAIHLYRLRRLDATS